MVPRNLIPEFFLFMFVIAYNIILIIGIYFEARHPNFVLILDSGPPTIIRSPMRNVLDSRQYY